MKLAGLIIVMICGGLLLTATQDFPAWGDPSSPASTHLSPHFITEALHETGAPNLVTAVLADYRGYDTMFETVVVFGAGLACILLLRTYTQRTRGREYRHIPTGIVIHIQDPNKAPKGQREFQLIDNMWVPHDLIIKTVCRILIPFIQIFGLYVVCHGDFSPGGGFQGGVIFGASLILLALSFDLRTFLEQMSEKALGLLCALGVVIYSGIGCMCILLGGNFLDYSQLAAVLPVDPGHVRALGMLGVEIGVGFSVMSVMAILYVNIASAGRHNQGL
ncbi:Na(+)/H(+) antiporter subunit B [Desulfovermiculus halophilus]|uniref:Na(+)/H(+) antiporter subunit B n=1 Tax=Desulfovermiculus halophilus TaxID=339722 RepID=UPI00048374EC|nr:Na(+)/H(+) antiporter subunit B [Desulfovermiculus halophilus]